MLVYQRLKDQHSRSVALEWGPTAPRRGLVSRRLGDESAVGGWLEAALGHLALLKPSVLANPAVRLDLLQREAPRGVNLKDLQCVLYRYHPCKGETEVKELTYVGDEVARSR